MSSANKIAKEFGWMEIDSFDPYMVSFTKNIDGCPARINVWNSKRGITVGTYINHPKQGKTQLFRKSVSISELTKIFKNPRVHTGKGYKFRRNPNANLA